MAKNHDKFDYYESKELGLEFAVPKTGEKKAMFSDGVVYSATEIELLKNGEITKEMHKFKKTFKGEIVKYEA